MPFTEPTAVPSSPPSYAAPSHNDLAAVAATVVVVGLVMAALVVWLLLRLRRASNHPARPTSTYTCRPSFTPSEASSKFGFTRKPLHLSHRRENGSWDFADPDPFSHAKEVPRTPSQKRQNRPAPLAPAPVYTPRTRRASTHKDELGPRTPTTPGTPGSMDYVEPPPPAYCADSSTPWPLHHPV